MSAKFEKTDVNRKKYYIGVKLRWY
jgi:hypothetical protein